eukprot:gene1123-15464_t
MKTGEVETCSCADTAVTELRPTLVRLLGQDVTGLADVKCHLTGHGTGPGWKACAPPICRQEVSCHSCPAPYTIVCILSFCDGDTDTSQGKQFCCKMINFVPSGNSLPAEGSVFR